MTTSSEPPPAKARILVVDDDSLIRRMLRLGLAKHGYTVIEAKDGVEALEKIHIEAPDLIVSDVMMPRMSGIELAEKLASDPQCAGIPFLVLSARKSAGKEEVSPMKGVSREMSKPFTFDKLRAVIEELLAEKGD